MADGTSVGSIYYDLDLDSKKFEANLSAADAKAKGFASQLGNQFEKSTQASQAFAGGLLAVGAGVLAAGGMALKSASDVEMLRANFDTLLGSADKGRELFGQLQKMANITPFDTQELAHASQTLLAMGVSTKDLLPTLSHLGDISLGNKDKLQSLALVFGQISSAGKLQGQDLLQLVNLGFNPLQKISQRTGESMTSLQAKMAAGQITFSMVSDEFSRATAKGGQFFGGMEKGAQTLPGLLSTASDAVSSMTRQIVGLSTTGDIIKGGLFDEVKGAVIEFITYLSAHQQDIINFFNSTFGFIAAHGPVIVGIIAGGLVPAFAALAVSVASTLVYLAPFMIAGAALVLLWEKARPVFFAVIGALVMVGLIIWSYIAPAVIAATAGFISMAVAAIVAFGPIVLIGAAIAAVAYLIVSHWGQIMTFFSKLWKWIVDGVAGFITDTTAWFNKLPENIAFALGWLVGRFVGFLIVDIPNFIGGVIGWFGRLPGEIGNAFASAYNAIIQWFGNMYNAARNGGSNIVNGFGSFINGLPGMVGGIFDNVVKTIMGFGQRLWDMAKNVAGSFWQGFKKGLGIASPSYIERAFMAIGKQSTVTLGQMKDDIGTLQGLGNNLMTMPKTLAQANSGQVNLPGNTGAATTPSNVSGGDVYHIDITGVLADSESAKRALGMDIVRAIDDVRRAQGKTQLLGST